MLNAGSNLFLHDARASSQRVLHPGRVVALSSHGFSAEFEEHDLTVEAGQQVIIYYQSPSGFMQKSVTVETVLQSENKPVISFQNAGAPVLAERRQCYRISTVIADVAVTLGSEASCEVSDISVIGLAVIAKKVHAVGDIVNVTITHKGHEFKGRACVQSATKLSQNQIRYGLHCVDVQKGGFNLENGLHQLSMALQRQQLRRLSGS